jgi:CheY-like chemotaxis protein
VSIPFGFAHLPKDRVSGARSLDPTAPHAGSYINGEEAQACVKDRAPDLVLSDVMMPVLDGFGLLRARAKIRTHGLSQ